MGNPPFQDVSPIKNGGFPLLMLVDQRVYTFQEPLILIALPPLTFQGVYVIQSNLCQSQSLGASELRITNLGSLVETWRSRKGAKNHDPTCAFWNAWWICFFFLFYGIHDPWGKGMNGQPPLNWYLSICLFRELGDLGSPNKTQERFNLYKS